MFEEIICLLYLLVDYRMLNLIILQSAHNLTGDFVSKDSNRATHPSRQRSRNRRRQSQRTSNSSAQRNNQVTSDDARTSTPQANSCPPETFNTLNNQAEDGDQPEVDYLSDALNLDVEEEGISNNN